MAREEEKGGEGPKSALRVPPNWAGTVYVSYPYSLQSLNHLSCNSVSRRTVRSEQAIIEFHLDSTASLIRFLGIYDAIN